MAQSKSSAVVLGSGGHAKVVVATMQAAGIHVAAVYDDDVARAGSAVLGIRVAGPVADAAAAGLPAVIALGRNDVRRTVAASLDLEWLPVIHPAAHVHSTVRVGAGTVVFAGAIVQPDTVLGSHVILNTGCSVDHDCVIDDFVHVAPGARLAGGVRVGSDALIGIASCVIPGCTIGSHAVVGAGAAVVADVPDRATVGGVPAATLRTRREP